MRSKLNQHFAPISQNLNEIIEHLVSCIEATASCLLKSDKSSPLDEILLSMDADLNGGWRDAVNKLHTMALDTKEPKYENPELSIYQIAALMLYLRGYNNVARSLLVDYYNTSYELGTREVIGRKVVEVRTAAKKIKTIKSAKSKKGNSATRDKQYVALAKDIMDKNPRLTATAVAKRMLNQNKNIRLKENTLAKKIAHLFS